MKVYSTLIEGAFVIEPTVYEDDRGFFYESFNHKEFEDKTRAKVEFKQDNHSKSRKGVLRGLHFQDEPYSQGKLVRCIYGEVFDVIVDLRKNSPSFSRWISVNLSSENKKQLWVPNGCAHGFLTLSEEADFLYKATEYYNVRSERCIIWNDPDLNINWPSCDVDVIVSEKDQKGISFRCWQQESK